MSRFGYLLSLEDWLDLMAGSGQKGTVAQQIQSKEAGTEFLNRRHDCSLDGLSLAPLSRLACEADRRAGTAPAEALPALRSKSRSDGDSEPEITCELHQNVILSGLT